MAKRDYGILSTGFFTNRKISDLSIPAQLLYIYISHGPHSNGIGLYRLPIDYIISDLRRPISKLKTKLKKSTVGDDVLIAHWLKELIELGMVSYCPQTEFIWIRDFLDWNPVHNRNVWVGRVRELNQVPKTILLDKEIKEILAKLSQIQADLGHGIKSQEKALIDKQIKRFSNRCETVSKGLKNETVSKPLRKGSRLPIPIPIPIPIIISIENNTAVRSKKTTILGNSGLIVPVKGNKSFTVPSELLEEWKKTYHLIDCEAEITDLIVWNKSNPGKQKTGVGIKRHINGWLAKANKDAAEKDSKNKKGVAKQFKGADYGKTGAI